MKLSVHIKNWENCMDEKVYVVVDVDRVPSVGELFYLSDEDEEVLLKKMKQSVDVLDNYRGCLYGKSCSKSHEDSEEDVTEEDMENLSIGDYIYVTQVALKCNKAGQYLSHVELGSHNPIKDLQ